MHSDKSLGIFAGMGKPTAALAPDPVLTAYVMLREGKGHSLYRVPILESTLRSDGEPVRLEDSLSMVLALAEREFCQAAKL